MREILDIINEKDEVIGSASYEKVHQEKLRHHVVVCMLSNEGGEILLQLRSASKSAYPSHWSFSFGGHVRKGESYQKGLVREGKEEIGVIFEEKDFIFRGEGAHVEQSGAPVIYKIYTTVFDGPIEEHTEEVDAVQFVSWEVMRRMIDEEKDRLHPIMVIALKRYFAKELGL